MTEREKLLQTINDGLAGMKPTRTGPIPYPDILKIPGADPILRRNALRQYAGAVLDTNSAEWTAPMRNAVAEELRNTLLEGGY